MRVVWASCLLLSLAWLGAAGQAEEVTWHSTDPTTGGERPSPDVTGPILDPKVQQAIYQAAPAPLPQVVDSESAEPPAAPKGRCQPSDAAETQSPPDYLPESAGQAPALAPVPPKMAAPGPPAETVQQSESSATSEAAEGPASFPGACSESCDAGSCAAPPATGCRLEFSADYLLWWARGQRLPPLVTTGPADQPTRGTLGAQGTVLLFGDQQVDAQARSGGRLRGTLWLGPEELIGLDVGGFLLEQASTDFAASSDSIPVLARPILLANTGAEGRQLVATPAIPGGMLDLHGQITVSTPSRLWGAEAGLRGNLVQNRDLRLDVLGGFRYLGLDEGLHITANTVSLQSVPGVPALDLGNQMTIADAFDTHNRFYGGDLGLRAVWHAGPWVLEGQARVALGANEEIVDIAGSRTFTPLGGQPQVSAGGLLALPSNSGHFQQDRFAVVPEVGVKVGYQLSDALCLFIGYDFLYWSEVVRPADQVDRTVDTRQVSGGTAASRPAFSFQQTSFWAQGLTCGLEVRY
jgi:hypothetical protein